MHIMEGYLPAGHCVVWGVASAPFLVAGVHRVKKVVREHPEAKMLLAASGAYVFVLSALKLPSVTGSCSHQPAPDLRLHCSGLRSRRF